MPSLPPTSPSALAAAIAAAKRGDVVEIAPLLPEIRRAHTRAYMNAAADSVDVAALCDVLARHDGIFLGDGAVVVRGEAGRAVVDGCVLLLEAKKLAHGMVPSPSSLKASFSSPDDAREVLQALVARLGGDDGAVCVEAAPLPSFTHGALVSSLAERPQHLFVGGAVLGLTSLVAPSVRRLRVELALAGRALHAAADDDDVYRGLARLDADRDSVLERREQDKKEGVVVDDGGFVVDAARVNVELVDRRLRDVMAQMKRDRAVLIGVVDPVAVVDLPALPLAQLSAVHVVVRSDADFEGAIVDAESGHIWPGADGAVSLSVPSLLMARPDVAASEDSFACLQAIERLRLMRSVGAIRPMRHAIPGSGSTNETRAFRRAFEVYSM